MILRPYQLDAVIAYAEALAANPAARSIISLPTGGGKTVTALEVAARMPGRVLMVAHRNELIAQPEAAARKRHPDWDIGVVKAGRDEVDAKDLVIASVQTLARKDRLARLVNASNNGAGAFALGIYDECHHSTSKSSRALLDAFPGLCWLGLTATPERSDGASLGKVWKDPAPDVGPRGICYRMTIRRAIEEGWLTKPQPRRIIVPGLDDQLKQIDLEDDDEVAKAMLATLAADHTAKFVADVVADGYRPAIFTVNVATAVATSDACKALGVASAWVSGATPKRERERILADHAAGRIKALANCAVLTEGYDDPGLDCVVMARPTRSRPLYIQACGRALRPLCKCGAINEARPCSCAKPHALIVDLVGAHAAHGLITADSLEDYSPFEETAPAKRRTREEIAALAGDDDDQTRLRLRNFLRALSGDLDLAAATVRDTVRWLCVAKNRCYVLAAGRHGVVHLERDPADAWTVLLEPAERGAAPMLLGTVATREDAQKVGEREAAARGLSLADQAAGWRGAPASPGQLAVLGKWHVRVPEGHKLTKGAASDLLTKRIALSKFRSRAKRPPIAAAVTGEPRIFEMW